MNLKAEVESKVPNKETVWHQKAWVTWVKESDCNSRLFHIVANRKGGKKLVKNLIDEDSVGLEGKKRDCC